METLPTRRWAGLLRPNSWLEWVAHCALIEPLLRELVAELNAGLDVKESTFTVEEAIDDWLAYGLPRRSAKTVRKLRTLCQRHLIPRLGARRLRDLTARDVERCLASLSTES